MEAKKLDPTVCPRCGSTNTDSFAPRNHLDEELAFYIRYVCCDCGNLDKPHDGEYTAHYETRLVQIEWDDPQGQHHTQESDETRDLAEAIKLLANLVGAADSLLENARDRGECYLDDEYQDYDALQPQQMVSDWEDLDRTKELCQKFLAKFEPADK